MQTEWAIRQYRNDDATMWDKLVEDSRQGTLLHCRGYMDYHADRFQDCSLIACRKGKPVVILPANRVGDKLYSHLGLTYGGWLTPRFHFDGTDMLNLFDCWIEWCKENDISEIFYKAVPHIYHRVPAEEDLYALFRFGATPCVTNLSSTINMREIPEMNTQQRRHLKKAISLQPWVRETCDMTEFMPILIDCLDSRHGASPVHSREELQMLKDRFPDVIRMFLCGTGSAPEAAVCIYDTGGVAHCQYIATSESGRYNGTLAFLFHRLINETFAGRRYFDFGTSNENYGLVLNSGLLHQKAGLGGRGVAYTSYHIDISKAT